MMKRPAATRSASARPARVKPKKPVQPKAKVSTQDQLAWLSHHGYVFLASLNQFIRAPLASFMTAAVIGIALALPTGLYLLLENAQQISAQWGGNVQISVFLKPTVTDEQARDLADQLYRQIDIQTVQVITRAEALAEYRHFSGFSDALQMLETNPLPAVLMIQPNLSHATPETISERLLKELQDLPEVEVAQWDMLWLKRLTAMMKIIKRGVLILGCLLGLAVLLIVGNTIRLAIYNRREEIEVTQLFGATDAFIRRPFLYSGLWYGLAGGLIAWLLVSVSFWLLQSPVQTLADLYYSEFTLQTLDIWMTVVLLTVGMFLGLTGAWLAVGRHLQEIRPR